MIPQIIINGLLAGLIYVIMALGFTLIFGIMRIVNFAHGEFYMVGAAAVLVLFGQMGWPFFAAVAAGGVVTGVLGLIFEKLLFRRLVGDETAGMIMSLALGIILQSLALIIFGPAEQTVTRPFSGIWHIGEAVVPWDRTIVALSALAILAVFYLFLKYARLGLAMQAVAQDPETSSLMGVESGLVYSASFGIACLLAGLAGALMAPIYTIGPYMGEQPMLKAFVVVILGGLGSLPGAVLGGLLIGLTESALSTYLDATAALIASFVIVLLIVVTRPTGLMGRGRAMKRLVVFIIVALVVGLPLALGNAYVMHIATMVGIMAPMALSMNLMLKIGQLSIAQPAFMGLGAYGSALLTTRLGVPPALAMLGGALVATTMAMIVGPVFLRIKGTYFVLLTYAFGQIVDLVFQEWTSLFGGNNGLYGIPKFSLFGFRLTATADYYLLGLIFTGLTYWVLRALERSDIGATFEALNENEMLARSLGSNALSWRIAAFTLGAFIAGISGGIYAFYIGFLSPDPFGFRASVDLIVINAIGGAGSVLGPLLGAVIVVPLPELLRDARQYQLLVYGICLLVFVLFLRQGLVSLIQRPRQKTQQGAR